MGFCGHAKALRLAARTAVQNGTEKGQCSTRRKSLLAKRARQDSNLQPLVPKTSALSIELRTRTNPIFKSSRGSGSLHWDAVAKLEATRRFIISTGRRIRKLGEHDRGIIELLAGEN